MTNRRVIVWLIVLLTLTGLAHLLLSYRGRFEDSLVQRSSLFGTQAEASTRLVLERAGAAGAVIERVGDWRLTEPYSSGVDQQVVMKLIGMMIDSPIENSIGDVELRRLGRTRADFGLNAPRLRVTVSGEGFRESAAFGKSTPDGGGIYAAIDGEKAVYVVSSNVFAAADLPPEGFRRRSLFLEQPETVDSVSVKRGTGSFVRFVRSGELWRMFRDDGGVPASAEKVAKLTEGLLTASATGFAWPKGEPGEPATATAALLAAYGLDPENAVTVTLKRKGLPDQQVSLGKDAGETSIYALVQGAEAIVTVDRALRDAAVADLSAFTDDRLFPYEMAQVSRLSIVDGETTYLLAKDADGNWVLDAPVAAATDAASVNALLDRLAGLRLADTNATGVAISMTSNSAPVTVAKETSLVGIRFEDLRSREILKIDPSGVKRLTVSGSGVANVRSVVYDRDRRVWNVESAEAFGKADAEAIESVLAALNPLKAEWIVKMKVSASDLRSYGLDTPRLTVAVDQVKDDSVRRNILVGNEAQGGSFATIGSSDAVFVLPRDTVRRLFTPLVREED